MTDADGTPLSVIVSRANDHDVKFLLPLVFLKRSRIGGVPGRPRQFPHRVRADRGDTSKDVLYVLGACGIEPEIPQRGAGDSPGLGRRRWPVERTHSWLMQFRRVGVRRERKLFDYQSFITLACSLIAYRRLAF